MPQFTAENKEKIINKVIERIVRKLPDKQAKLCADLLRQLYDTVAYDDLALHTIDDLYGSAVTFWNFIYQRKPGETKIRIYNPEYEKHGWQSTHTIIEIIHDDMPFLIDSVSMEINRLDLTIHWMMHIGGMKICRDQKHRIAMMLNEDHVDDVECFEEAPIYIEIDRQTDPVVLKKLKSNLTQVLEDVGMVVRDWRKIRQKVVAAIDDLDQIKQYLHAEELRETKDFLSWIKDDHFTFLGVHDYELIGEGEGRALKAIAGTGLGLLHDHSKADEAHGQMLMTPEASRWVLSAQILLISKTDTRSTVHRPVYSDYIGIKRYNECGEVIGVRCIIGLYTSIAYNTNPSRIPFLRHKVAMVIEKTLLNKASHAGKALINILETLPRDDLFQASVDDLLDLAMGIYHLQERRRIRLFVRKEVYGRFISCLVYVPKDRYNTDLHRQIQIIFRNTFAAKEITFFTRFSDSVLARIHFVIRIDPEVILEYDVKEIEKKLIQVGRSWGDDLASMLLDVFGEERGNDLVNKYGNAFSASYREEIQPRTAVYDIKHIDRLKDKDSLEINFYLPVSTFKGTLHLKVYLYDNTIPLSDALPVLENMGLRVISEHPYSLRSQDGRLIWINDFGMRYDASTLLYSDDLKENLQEIFNRVWRGEVKSDSLNKLVLKAGLNWREIVVLRSYAKYLRQIGFTFSQDYIEHTLITHVDITKNLIGLFLLRFDPNSQEDYEAKVEPLENELLEAMDAVASLDEDRILKCYLALIKATLRTNYFQRQENDNYKSYLSFKFAPGEIPSMPVPIPQYEIFVYSPRFEGVHLRGAKVARGGVRWSDRREDFRTEVLGLMKAQQVKNAVIVPAGAKGGFIPKHLPEGASREVILAEAISCYQNFIRGLLDVTDNRKGEGVVKPKDTVCYDEDDPYLVVAADKGTATFSDIANEIAEEYDFWLGDAFASGGSTGYDHKKMGITARGAWESVKRHFRKLDINVQTTSFTVIGVGDMAGDVFGNGMLLSRHIKLVAVFNHAHIFLDPDPDIKVSYKERERLFNLPRSSWEDYNTDLISKGGGVYKRSAKSIKLSAQVKALLGLEQSKIVPNELIRAILRAPVDLLWSGGIGTFIKASSESDSDVGDKTNDGIRIDANELVCKVIGEGANLGVTQLARIEYVLNGGLAYTDFIDNSGGVDCSDHEVNIKILLNDIIENGDMTEKQRNILLAEMTDEVGDLVLHSNYKQAQAISIAANFSAANNELYVRYIDYLENQGVLVRSQECLPEAKVLIERKLGGKGLTAPAIAVLLSYTKTLVKDAILNSDILEDPYLSEALVLAFPQAIRENYREQMAKHRLRREIIATQVSNKMINEMGLTFAYRQAEETGEGIPIIVRAYTIARSVFETDALYQAIEALDNKIPEETQMDIMAFVMHLLGRATHWFLRNRRGHQDIVTIVDYFSADVKKFRAILPKILGEKGKAYVESQTNDYLTLGMTKKLAQQLAQIRFLLFSLDIIEISKESDFTLQQVASIYFSIGEHFGLDWLRGQIFKHASESHWEALSKEALRDDFNWQQRKLT
ncbi:MAG: NAD-glutamate dehydrogenase, partial [Gammaproteobacteria bacterium]